MYLIMLTSQHTDTALALSEPNLDTSPSTRTLGDQTKYSGSRVKEVQTLAHCTLHNCTGQHHGSGTRASTCLTCPGAARACPLSVSAPQ